MGAVSIVKRMRVVDGATVVLCLVCDEEKPWPAGFARKGKEKRSGVCRDCVNERKQRYQAEGRLNIDLERRAESSRRWRELHPERYKRACEEYRQRVKADPERHARFLEGRRIEYRLRQERKGRDLSSIGAAKAMKLRQPPRMPLDALREAFERSQLPANEIARRLGWNRPNSNTGGEGTRVLRLLGLSGAGARSDRREGVKREITFEAAAKLAEAIGVDPFEVGV